MIVSIVGICVGVLGIAFALRFYYELWKWARQCQNVRIAIEYKGKVKTQQPIIEWLLWANQLDRDKDSNGRVLYHLGGTRVAILKGWGNTLTFHHMLRDGARGIIKAALPSRKTKAPTKRTGAWKATDQTPKENRIRQ